MLLSLLFIPLVGLFFISAISNNQTYTNLRISKLIALTTSIVNLLSCIIVFVFFNFSSNQFQFVQENYNMSSLDFYLGIDGISIYFILLTGIIMPISLLSNWNSISENVISFIIIILLLETLLMTIFLVLDILLFYIFFESILPPLFLLIGIFGSDNRVRASFYLFLYTLLGSLFLLLSILDMSSIMGTTDYNAIYKANFNFYSQIFLFCGILIAFAVKTPTIFLNTWLLKAHVESPLGGSIILAAIVLKLSLYGILRLILPLLPKAYILLTPTVYVIGVITILYASLSTIRTIDVKELIAYSSVSHAAVYLLGVFSNIIQGIEGGIILGLAHGFVSSGLFICAGGVLYDRSSTRLINFYRGMTQIMPLFSILFFILCLGNAGTPLSLNFIGEFLSLYGTFERLPTLGIFASSSIVFSAAYTIYMFNRISFAGSLSRFFIFNVPDLSQREFNILLILVVFTVVLGVYPAPVLDGLHYSVSSIICDGPNLLEDQSNSISNIIGWDLLKGHTMYYLIFILFGVGLMIFYGVRKYLNYEKIKLFIIPSLLVFLGFKGILLYNTKILGWLYLMPVISVISALLILLIKKFMEGNTAEKKSIIIVIISSFIISAFFVALIAYDLHFIGALVLLFEYGFMEYLAILNNREIIIDAIKSLIFNGKNHMLLGDSEKSSLPKINKSSKSEFGCETSKGSTFAMQGNTSSSTTGPYSGGGSSSGIASSSTGVSSSGVVSSSGGASSSDVAPAPRKGFTSAQEGTSLLVEGVTKQMLDTQTEEFKNSLSKYNQSIRTFNREATKLTTFINKNRTVFRDPDLVKEQLDYLHNGIKNTNSSINRDKERELSDFNTAKWYNGTNDFYNGVTKLISISQRRADAGENYLRNIQNVINQNGQTTNELNRQERENFLRGVRRSQLVANSRMANHRAELDACKQKANKLQESFVDHNFRGR